MITSIGQVMIYVNDVAKAAIFWHEKVGFEYSEKNGASYIVAPSKTSEVQLVLHDKEAVAKMSPELNLGTPSLLMTSNNLETTYQTLLAKGVSVNPIVDLGFMKVFNFSDEEGNYFAVREIQ